MSQESNRVIEKIILDESDKIKKPENKESLLEVIDENKETSSSPEPTHLKRPDNIRSNTSISTASTDEDEYQDRILIDDGIPSNIPLESLAGPALILPSNDLDGHTLTEEFDWIGKDDEDDGDSDEKDNTKNNALSKSGVFICLNKNSSHIAWFCIFLFTLIWLSVDVAIFVVYKNRVTMTSYNLELWFTWIAFMWCIAFLSQIFVELVPWAIRKSASYLRPRSIEVLRMRLSYYKALRPYIKLLIISAWNWGSWAFIKDHVPLPIIGQNEYGMNVYRSKPGYVSTFYSIWECIFFASLFLFIEKFILQLIVTSFHKKAYGDRIKENDRALRILDKLRKSKKKNPQEFLLKRIRRKPKTTESQTNTAFTSRSHSLDDNSDFLHGQSYPPPTQHKSIIRPQLSHQFTDNKSCVKFPEQNIDTLNPIPPIEDRCTSKSEDEKHDEDVKVIEAPKTNQKFMDKLTSKIKKRSSQQPYLDNDNSHPHTLSRESTWFARSSSDEKGFFGATRDFVSTNNPTRILKDGYNKFVSPNKKPNYQQAQNSINQAKYLAKKIFRNLVGLDSQRDTIVESDFIPFFKTAREASYAFDLFDTDGNGDLSKHELRSGCIKIYRERKNLTRSMRDLSQATGKLDIILMVIFTAIWAIIVCAAFGVNVGTDLMPLWSAFVAASFIFGTSARDAFEAVIFVFVTHPYDSGDRVLIGNENWVVQNVGLLITTFTKWDGTVVYAKNSVLSTQYIINVRRSGRTGETLELQISFETPSWKIKQLAGHMSNWTNQYPKLYTPNSASTNVTAFHNQNMISLSFYFEHTQNWQIASNRWLRHNNFMYELKEECERLNITYSLPSQPISNINPENDAPPESYNMGKKSSYGLDGMVQRKPYVNEDSHPNRPIGDSHTGNPSSHGNSNDDGGGAFAGSAATLMFASM